MPKRGARERPSRHVTRTSAITMAIRALKRRQLHTVPARKPGKRCRSFAPKSLQTYEDDNDAIGIYGEDVIAGELFYDEYYGTGNSVAHAQPRIPYVIPIAPTLARARSEPEVTQKNGHDVMHLQHRKSPKTLCGTRVHPQAVDKKSANKLVIVRRSTQTTSAGKRPGGAGPGTGTGTGAGDERDNDFIPDFLEDIFDNSDRHAIGLNILRRVFGSGKSSSNVKIDRSRRPFFTYWVTVIQVVIFIVGVSTYGFARVGLGSHTQRDQILMTNLATENVARTVQNNMWIGPPYEALIYLGAKYSPCMRKDRNIERLLSYDRALEAQTACCVFNDGSGCVQTAEKGCSPRLSTWFKWSKENPGSENRVSGSVCGQDPLYCADPVSTGAFVWADNITQWPICKETRAATPSDVTYHVTCDVVGRPCCIGIQGACVIRTRDYCDFIGGFFNENATLCSQVNCIEETCGMFSFLEPQKPDQFYRLFTSLFIHAGLIGLVVTVLLQLTIMRDLEKLIGWWAMTLIYLVSGVVGSLGSAVFIPYAVEAGPSGAQFGVLGVMLIEVLRWNKDSNPWRTLMLFAVLLVVLFVVGALLSQVDNYAHLFGLCFGCLLCAALRPYRSMCGVTLSTVARVILSVVCFALALLLFAMLIVLFYVLPVYECKTCMYFNCIPLFSNCADQSVTLGRENAVK